MGLTSFKDGVELVGKALDVAGVAVIVGGILLATVVHARRLIGKGAREQYRLYRQAVVEPSCWASRSSLAPTSSAPSP